MAYWDQVFQYKKEIKSRGILTAEDFRDLSFQLDTATGFSTAYEKINVLLELIKTDNIRYQVSDDVLLEIESPFELTYLLKVNSFIDVYADIELKKLFPAASISETIKWQKLLKSKTKQSWFTNYIQRRIQNWFADYHVKEYVKDLKN